MSGRSVNLTTLFLGRLRPPKRLTSTSCAYYPQKLTTALLNLMGLHRVRGGSHLDIFLSSITSPFFLTFSCTTIPRYPIFNTRYSVICKVYTGYCGTSEIEHGLCACTVDNPLAKARGLSLRTGAQPMLYLPLGDGPI